MATPADLRVAFEARLKDTNPPPTFHSSDLERKNNDAYLKRILLHHNNDLNEANDMLWDILIWRQNVDANDINENNICTDYLNEGLFFPHGRDKDGCLLFIFKVKMHVKSQRDGDELRKLIIYWLDRLERQENGKPITLFLDMDGSGLKNIDFDLVKYLITLFKLYYPVFLNNIIVFKMPWVLTAAYIIVKTFLPDKAIELIKFVNKDNLDTFISPDQALRSWGGHDSYVFQFVPEVKEKKTVCEEEIAMDSSVATNN